MNTATLGTGASTSAAVEDDWGRRDAGENVEGGTGKRLSTLCP